MRGGECMRNIYLALDSGKKEDMKIEMTDVLTK